MIMPVPKKIENIKRLWHETDNTTPRKIRIFPITTLLTIILTIAHSIINTICT